MRGVCVSRADQCARAGLVSDDACQDSLSCARLVCRDRNTDKCVEAEDDREMGMVSGERWRDGEKSGVGRKEARREIEQAVSRMRVGEDGQ